MVKAQPERLQPGGNNLTRMRRRCARRVGISSLLVLLGISVGACYIPLTSSQFYDGGYFIFDLHYESNGASAAMPKAQFGIRSGEGFRVDRIYSNHEMVPGVFYSNTRDEFSKIFVEWNTRADGRGTGYAPGDTIVADRSLIEQLSDRQFRLYAIWEAVGQPGPGGGYVFYVDHDDSFDWRYLEAISGEAMALLEDPELDGNNWRTYWWPSNDPDDPDPPDFTSPALGTGRENTNHIIHHAGADLDNTAAHLADRLALRWKRGGEEYEYNDWFLPSREELRLVHARLGGRNDLIEPRVTPLHPEIEIRRDFNEERHKVSSSIGDPVSGELQRRTWVRPFDDSEEYVLSSDARDEGDRKRIAFVRSFGQ